MKAITKFPKITPELCFEMYYKLGTTRSLAKLYSGLGNFYPGEVIPKEITLRSWSKKYKWFDRIEKLDDLVRNKLTSEIGTEAVRNKKKYAKFLNKLIDEVIKEKKLLKGIKIKDINDLTKVISTLAETLDTGSGEQIKVIIERVKHE